MHWIARIMGIWGGFALIGAWVFPSRQHLYNDAIVLTLISISALVCALVYLQQEKVN